MSRPPASVMCSSCADAIAATDGLCTLCIVRARLEREYDSEDEAFHDPTDDEFAFALGRRASRLRSFAYFGAGDR